MSCLKFSFDTKAKIMALFYNDGSNNISQFDFSRLDSKLMDLQISLNFLHRILAIFLQAISALYVCIIFSRVIKRSLPLMSSTDDIKLSTVKIVE